MHTRLCCEKELETVSTWHVCLLKPKLCWKWSRTWFIWISQCITWQHRDKDTHIFTPTRTHFDRKHHLSLNMWYCQMTQHTFLQTPGSFIHLILLSHYWKTCYNVCADPSEVSMVEHIGTVFCSKYCSQIGVIYHIFTLLASASYQHLFQTVL